MAGGPEVNGWRTRSERLEDQKWTAGRPEVNGWRTRSARLEDQKWTAGGPEVNSWRTRSKWLEDQKCTAGGPEVNNDDGAQEGRGAQEVTPSSVINCEHHRLGVGFEAGIPLPGIPRNSVEFPFREFREWAFRRYWNSRFPNRNSGNVCFGKNLEQTKLVSCKTRKKITFYVLDLHEQIISISCKTKNKTKKFPFSRFT